jgi:hypothetical protein
MHARMLPGHRRKTNRACIAILHRFRSSGQRPAGWHWQMASTDHQPRRRKHHHPPATAHAHGDTECIHTPIDPCAFLVRHPGSITAAGSPQRDGLRPQYNQGAVARVQDREDSTGIHGGSPNLWASPCLPCHTSGVFSCFD